MIKPNSKPKLSQPIDISVNFTFATPKSKRKNKKDIDLTSTEKKVLGMWLKTVLEQHSNDFIHALKSSRKFSVVGLSKYLSRYYAHLKTIVHYYIIAAMIDYQLIITDKHEEINLEKQCPFINIVIEELTSRFFKESQWLHKINYLPIYTIFPFLDQYYKGYTTLSEIGNIIKMCLPAKLVKSKVSSQKQQRLNKKKQKLLDLKLKNNIQGQDVNIYQENIDQLMLRVNLINFEQKSGAASQRYQSIKRILAEHDHFMTEKYEKECEQMVREKIKEKEELQILRESYKIKQRSNIMSKMNEQKQNQNATNKESQTSKGYYSYKVPESIFSTMPHYSSNLTASKPQNIDLSLMSRNRQLGKYSILNYDTAIRTQVQAEQLAFMQRAEEEMKENILIQQNLLHHQFVDQNLRQIQKNKKAIQYRNTILEQLQLIREQKKTNHFRLLNYI